MKCNNLYLGLVTPSNGWWSPIVGLAPLLAAFIGLSC